MKKFKFIWKRLCKFVPEVYLIKEDSSGLYFKFRLSEGILKVVECFVTTDGQTIDLPNSIFLYDFKDDLKGVLDDDEFNPYKEKIESKLKKYIIKESIRRWFSQKFFKVQDYYLDLRNFIKHSIYLRKELSLDCDSSDFSLELFMKSLQLLKNNMLKNGYNLEDDKIEEIDRLIKLLKDFDSFDSDPVIRMENRHNRYKEVFTLLEGSKNCINSGIETWYY